MRKIGKQGKINNIANKKIKALFLEKDIRYCEARLDGCQMSMYLSIAHKHKRVWYKSQPEKLYDFSEVILCCISCHQKLEANRELTEEIFKQKRS
jgi:hypothetical protein